jgi:hypothetical protein
MILFEIRSFLFMASAKNHVVGRKKNKKNKLATLFRSVSALSGSSAANIADEMRIQARIMFPK